MESMEIFAQAVGIVAMLFNIFSYQGKQQKTIVAMQLVGTTLFSVNYLLLGAAVGGILNILGAIRSILFLFREKFKADRIAWLLAFLAAYLTVYVLNFTVLGKEPTAFHLIVELLPVIGMLALNIGFRWKDSAKIRKCALVSSPAWLIYNFAAGSWGAIICEMFTLISIFVGMFRHDKKQK